MPSANQPLPLLHSLPLTDKCPLPPHSWIRSVWLILFLQFLVPKLILEASFGLFMLCPFLEIFFFFHNSHRVTWSSLYVYDLVGYHFIVKLKKNDFFLIKIQERILNGIYKNKYNFIYIVISHLFTTLV